MISSFGTLIHISYDLFRRYAFCARLVLIRSFLDVSDIVGWTLTRDGSPRVETHCEILDALAGQYTGDFHVASCCFLSDFQSEDKRSSFLFFPYPLGLFAHVLFVHPVGIFSDGNPRRFDETA